MTELNKNGIFVIDISSNIADLSIPTGFISHLPTDSLRFNMQRLDNQLKFNVESVINGNITLLSVFDNKISIRIPPVRVLDTMFAFSLSFRKIFFEFS